MMLVIVAGCSEKGTSFKAIVLESNGTHLLVEPEEGSAERSSADKISVFIQDAKLSGTGGAEITSDDIEVGMTVEVFYRGGIAESYPAQIFECYKIQLLED